MHKNGSSRKNSRKQKDQKPTHLQAIKDNKNTHKKQGCSKGVLLQV